MMVHRLTILTLLVVVAMLVTTACSDSPATGPSTENPDEEQTENQTASVERGDPDKDDDQTANEPPVGEDGPPDRADQVLIDAAFVKEYLKRGDTTEKVQQLLGHDYIKVQSALDGRNMWRYDFPAYPGYHFEAVGNMDDVDVEGLRTGKMRMQLFISWDEQDQVYDYSVFYRDEDGSVKGYYRLSTGEEKVDVLTPPAGNVATSREWIEVELNEESLEVLQEEVDQGHKPGNLDPEHVAYEFINREGVIEELNRPLDSSVAKGDEESVVTLTVENGKTIFIKLIQPVKKGTGGIWAVKEYRIMH
ncbi:MAG: hypothetical protein H0Z33_14470 [Bacillaceae bacterium]|nr:hypothetical protein [Bacillaceae bacterium]